MPSVVRYAMIAQELLGGGYSLTSRANALGDGADSTPNAAAYEPWASFLFVKIWGQSITFPTTMPARRTTAVSFLGLRMREVVLTTNALIRIKTM